MTDNQQCSADQDVCGDSLWRPPKFDLRFLFIITGLAAVWTSLSFVLDRFSLAVITVVMLTWLFGCPRTKRASLIVAAATYMPFAWLLFVDYPWVDYRLFWIGMWGYLPGVIPAKILAAATLVETSDAWIASFAAVFTAVFFLAGVSVIRFWPKTRWWVFWGMLALSSLFSLGCYQGFLV